MDHPLSAVKCWTFFLILSQKSIALRGAVVSVDYESGKWQGRSVSRRYHEKSKARWYFSSTRKTWQTNNNQTIDGWWWMDLFCDWWAFWFVGLVYCCLVELLNQGKDCKDVQSWVCHVIVCRQDGDKIDNMMGDIFVGDIGQAVDAIQFRTIAVPLCNCNWSWERPGLERIMHAETQICWTSMILCEQLWTQLVVPYSVEVQFSSTLTVLHRLKN